MLNHKDYHPPAAVPITSGMMSNAAAPSDSGSGYIHQQQHRRRRPRLPNASGIGIKSMELLDRRTSRGQSDSSLKFKRKCQSIDRLLQLELAPSSSSSWWNFGRSKWAMSVLILTSIFFNATPIGIAAAAVTRETPLPVSNGPSASQQAGSVYSAASAAAVSAAAATTPPPIIRLPSNSLIKYTAYRDVSILHFQVPRDTRTLYYSFRAHEEFKSAFPGNKCEPRNITLHIKARSYPVISPENIQFPHHFFDERQREKIHTLEFKSNSVEAKLTIGGPLPGSWFGVAFISWTDPNLDRIEQQGLTVSCETILQSEMSVQRADPEIIMDGSYRENTVYDNQSEPYSYKFHVPVGVEYVKLHFNVLETCVNCPDVQVAVAADTFPNADNYLEQYSYWTNITSANELHFFTTEEMWHYIDVAFSAGPAATPVQDGEEAAASKGIPKASAAAVNEFKYNITVEFVYVNDTDVDEEDGDGSAVAATLLPRISYDTHSLMRQTYREFFMYDFDLQPDAYNEMPQYVNVSTSPILMQFAIGDTYDIGGTLSLAVAFYTSSRSSDYGAESLKVTTPGKSSLSLQNEGPVAERLIDDSGGAAAASGHVNMTLIVCMRVGAVGIPTWPRQCIYGRQVFEPVIVINTTSEYASTGLVHIPYPETGRWMVTMGLFCNGEQRTAPVSEVERLRSFIGQNVNLLDEMIHPLCECQANREALKACVQDETRHCFYQQMNETALEQIKQCMLSLDCVQNHQNVKKRFETHQHLYSASKEAATVAVAAGKAAVTADEGCNSRLVFTIASNPCVAGRCGQYGKCFHYMSGGVVYSTCLCNKGYRGWDCTEDSEVPSSYTILLASLLLTLSNLLFLPSIYFAVKRSYYTEAVIYFSAMFFSAFYHACDSGEDEYSFCLVKGSVLQFSDFYCGLLAIWVTLIAMANLKSRLVSILHMLGAIVLAFGTELNKQSLWVFLTPAVTGLCIITTSWGLRCYRTRKWFPSRKYYSVFLPIGAVLVMVGLSCYALLQTKQNYHIVHSIWHMVMALSLLCLLPNQKSFIPES